MANSLNVESVVRDRHFSVGIDDEFDKLNACSVDGVTTLLPRHFEVEGVIWSVPAKNRLKSLQIDSLSLQQVQYMLAGTELAEEEIWIPVPRQQSRRYQSEN